MKGQESECRPSEGAGSSQPFTQLGQLGAAIRSFQKNTEKLRKEDSCQRETGRSSKTLVKQQDFRIVLVLMKARLDFVGLRTLCGRFPALLGL
jgi:hypothetical protein